jgi:hypothetical protein
MDRWSRNRRLYETLKGMGLYVSPIFADGDCELIDALCVSVDLAAEKAAKSALIAQRDVIAPVQGAEIGNVVAPAQRSGDGVVVKFPPVI